jgi:hypothetical protein
MEGAMFRFILLVLLAAVGFYVAWPAYTGYRIHRALEAGNQPALEATIDFPSVRRSMRGPVIRQVDRRIEAVMRDLGPAAKAVADQIPRDKIEQVIDGALATVITPPQVIDIYAKGGNYNAAIKEAIMVEIDKIGGLPPALPVSRFRANSPSCSRTRKSPAASPARSASIPQSWRTTCSRHRSKPSRATGEPVNSASATSRASVSLGQRPCA